MKLTTINKPIREQKEFVKLVDEGDYFKQMDYLIKNSSTATMLILMFKKYCVLENIKEEYVDLWEKIVDEKAKYGMFTLWCEFNSDLNIKQVYFRHSKNYRVKEFDDLDNVSEFLNVKTNKRFPAFNPNKDILTAQIKKAKGFLKFSGQIFQYNTTTEPYETTPLYSVQNWMKIEEDTPNHISASADNALFGNNLFIMKDGVDSSDDTGEKEITNKDRIVSALRSAKSVKNSGTNFVLEWTGEDEDLSKIFVKHQIGNDIDIDKFNNVDDKAAKRICTAFYCFPHILAMPSEGLFGNSGEAYQNAINFWSKTCAFEAEKINNAFKKIGINLKND
jgi:hypothetical protein